MAQEYRSDSPNQLEQLFSERYMSVIQEMGAQLWRRYPNVTDLADRDDVIEETLRRVAEHESRHGPVQNLRPIVRHIFSQVVAKLLRRSRYKLRLSSFEDTKQSVVELEDSAERLEQRMWVADILGASDERTRAVLTLRYLAGFETHEVATIVGISADNVRQIVHRVREKWRSQGRTER
jgi:RNA polymerase sigma factor (sigma-70 family)